MKKYILLLIIPFLSFSQNKKDLLKINDHLKKQVQELKYKVDSLETDLVNYNNFLSVFGGVYNRENIAFFENDREDKFSNGIIYTIYLSTEKKQKLTGLIYDNGNKVFGPSIWLCENGHLKYRVSPDDLGYTFEQFDNKGRIEGIQIYDNDVHLYKNGFLEKVLQGKDPKLNPRG